MKQKLTIKFLALHIAVAIFSQNQMDLDFQGKWFQVNEANCHDSINSIEFFPDSTFLQRTWQTTGPYDVVAMKGNYRIESKGSMFLVIENEQLRFGSDSEFASSISMNSESPPQRMSLLLAESTGFCLVSLKNIPTGSEYEWIYPRCYVNSFTLLSDESHNESKGVFLIPSGYTGRIMIALNQESGQEAVFDDRNRRVLSIPESGLLKTRAKPMPVAFAKNQFEYYYLSEEGVMLELKQISNTCLNSLARLSEEEIINLGYDVDEVYVFPERYNPARNLINEHFEEEIVGQVKLVIVDVLKNLVPNFD